MQATLSLTQVPAADTIELTNAAQFNGGWDHNAPLYPVLRELGSGALHRIVLTLPEFPPEELAGLLSGKLLRSDTKITDGGADHWEAALFRTRGGVFVQWSSGVLSVFARERSHAARIARRVSAMITTKLKARNVAGYLLIKKKSCDVEAEFVTMETRPDSSRERLSLLYGDAFLSWHDGFLAKFVEKPSGISVFEGPPGCGKTSYIRVLISLLFETHRFYYIAPHDIYLLSEPEFIPFWKGERDKHRGRKLVLVVEDAEQALMSRENDNRSLVSTLLNYSDGLLSEFLRMQILCTVNCAFTRLDKALLRPGRLLGRRYFGPLSHADGLRLARSIGREMDLRVEYSLAEIFCEDPEEELCLPRPVGFAN